MVSSIAVCVCDILESGGEYTEELQQLGSMLNLSSPTAKSPASAKAFVTCPEKLRKNEQCCIGRVMDESSASVRMKLSHA